MAKIHIKLGVLLVLLCAGQAWGASLNHTVCASGCNYTTAQAALTGTAYTTGDTITVSGTIVETGGINFGGADDGVTIQGDGTWVSDLNTGAITINASHGITIKNATITNSVNGITDDTGTDNVTLQNLTFTSCSRAISTATGEGWTISGITISGTADKHAITFDTCAGTHTLTDIDITLGNGATRNGILFTACSGTFTVTGLDITGGPALTGVRITGSSSGTINLSNVTISTLSGAFGILIDVTSSTTVNLTTASISGTTNDPIKLNTCTGDITMSGLTITPAGTGGIYIVNSASGTKTIQNTTISGGTGSGIYASGSASIVVSDFAISNLNATGIFLTNVSNSSFTRGTITTAKGDVFHTEGGSSGVTASKIIVSYCGDSTDATKGSGDAFTAHGTDSNISIYNCVAHNNLNTALAFVGTSSGTVYNFTAYNNGGAAAFGSESVRAGMYISLDDESGGGWVIKNYVGQGNYPYEIQLSASAYADLTISNNCYLHTGNGVTEALFANVDSANKTWAQWVALEKETSGKYATMSINANYALPAGHEALNSGTPIWTRLQYTTNVGDAAGNLYIYGTAPDIGAYERKQYLFDDNDEMIPKKCKSTNAACYVQP